MNDTDKEKLTKAIQQTERANHCESCGTLNPNVDDGYTTCCNELVCRGTGRNSTSRYGYSHYSQSRFGTKTDNGKACCWAVADLKFELAGRKVPDGACKLL
jgi:hypothetical protein